LNDIDLAELLEAMMLICFGLSWPISILKAVRLKFVQGKSIGFMALVFLGYTAGTVAKFADAAATSKPLKLVTILYIFNGLMVFVDMALYMKYRRNASPVTSAGVDADLPKR